MRAYDADQSYSISPRRATTTSGLATLQRQTFASCQHVSRQLTHCIELPRQSLARFAMRGYEHDHAHIAQPRHRHRLTGHGMSHARRRAGGTCTATSHAQLRTPHMSAQCHAHVRCIARTCTAAARAAHERSAFKPIVPSGSLSFGALDDRWGGFRGYPPRRIKFAALRGAHHASRITRQWHSVVEHDALNFEKLDH